MGWELTPQKLSSSSYLIANVASNFAGSPDNGESDRLVRRPLNPPLLCQSSMLLSHFQNVSDIFIPSRVSANFFLQSWSPLYCAAVAGASPYGPPWPFNASCAIAEESVNSVLQITEIFWIFFAENLKRDFPLVLFRRKLS